MKDVGGEVLVEREQVLGGWGEYFESLLNVTDVRQASIIAVEGGRMPRMRNTNEKIGSREINSNPSCFVDAYSLPFHLTEFRISIPTLGRTFFYNFVIT